MHLSTCNSCGQLVYFENTACTRCGAILGFNSDSLQVDLFTLAEDGLLAPIESDDSHRYRYCANGLIYKACNWIVNTTSADEFYNACQLNRTIPDLNVGNNLTR